MQKKFKNLKLKHAIHRKSQLFVVDTKLYRKNVKMERNVRLSSIRCQELSLV